MRYDPDKPTEFDAIKRSIALIKEKRIPVANQGKFKPAKICELLSERLGKKINISTHTKAWKYYAVRKQGYQAEGCKTEYCQFDEAHNDYIYTQAWIDFLVERFSDSAEYEKVLQVR